MSEAQFVLASRSPRRADLLRNVGFKFLIEPAGIDESITLGEGPRNYVRRMARSKATHIRSDLAVLGADTVVNVDGEVLGKPADRDQAISFLDTLSGREHEVVTAVAISLRDRIEVVDVVTKVRFRDLKPGEAARYWDTGEPVDKAGGYGLQGVGAVFVDVVTGSYSAVIGLPLVETERLLSSFGVDTWRNRT
ncbi:MAG: nucleoside triphosphate pyrophosphatase [Pseudomonadota bacterium]|nr:nucleoside triphosphate pyrophosphatase [Pseudomonadota bacterium]